MPEVSLTKLIRDELHAMPPEEMTAFVDKRLMTLLAERARHNAAQLIAYAERLEERMRSMANGEERSPTKSSTKVGRSANPSRKGDRPKKAEASKVETPPDFVKLSKASGIRVGIIYGRWHRGDRGARLTRAVASPKGGKQSHATKKPESKLRAAAPTPAAKPAIPAPTPKPGEPRVGPVNAEPARRAWDASKDRRAEERERIARAVVEQQTKTPGLATNLL
jgi:hypothetical protein